MAEKFIQKISRAIRVERIEELKEKIFEPKSETTQYYQNLAKAPNITTIPFFSFLHYKG